MTMNAINPRLIEVLNANVGSKLTPELSAGLAGSLQQLMNTIAQEAFAAGRRTDCEEATTQDMTMVTDVEAKAV